MTSPSTSAETPDSMTIQEKLTAEFSELDRVTPRPLTHEEYAIAAIQFYHEMGNIDLQPIVTEQQQTIEYQHDKLLEQEVKIEQLQKHLNETDDALHVAINLRKYDVKKLDEAHDKNIALQREVKEYTTLYHEYKDRYEFTLAESTYADKEELKGLRYMVNELECERDRALVRANRVEEWLTEYRDHLKKVDFKEKQTLINEINELLNEK